MQRLGQMPRASACSIVFLPLSCIYHIFSLFSDAGCFKGNCPGQLPGQPRHVHRSWPPGMSHDLPAGSIKIVIAAALFLILFWIIIRIMMILNETTKLRINGSTALETIALLRDHRPPLRLSPFSKTIALPGPYSCLFLAVPSFNPFCNPSLRYPASSLLNSNPKGHLFKSGTPYHATP